MQYDNVGDANAKLVGTLAYYDNKGIYIQEVLIGTPTAPGGSTIVVVFSYPGSKKTGSCMLDDSKLRYMQYNIGYVNHRGNSAWFYRMPVRQYRQGLRGDQLGSRDETNLARTVNIRFGDIARQTTAFTDMIENNYPGIEEVVKQLEEHPEYVKMAFHRNFAMYRDKFRKDYVIEYKGQPIGFKADIDGPCQMTDDFVFLREELQRAGIKVK